MPKKDSVLKIEYNPKSKASTSNSTVLTVVSSGQTSNINNSYLLRDGSLSMTGHLNMGLKNIISVGTVDGVDVSAHADNSNIHIDHSTLQIIAGNGLEGGGNLTSNKTLTLGTPGTIDVTTINQSTGTTHYHAITSSSNPGQTSSLLSTNNSGDLTLFNLSVNNFLFAPTIKSSSSIVLSPSSPNVNPEGSILKDLGDYNRKWRSVFAAELIVENLVAQNVIATIGGRILVAPTTKLIADANNSVTTIDVEHNIFVQNDYIYLATAPNGIAQIESMRITSTSPTTITGGYRYSVTRNVDGTVANSWVAGDAVVLLREGYIDITSTSTILNHLGPTITIYSRNSSTTWNDFYATVAQGNLRSFVDYSTNVHGIAVGNNLVLTPTTGFVGATVDATNGLRLFNTPLKMYNGGTQTIGINSHNDLWIGTSSSDKKLTWNGTTLTVSGTINVTGGNAALTNLSNSAISTLITGNSIQVGSGAKDSTLSGWNIDSTEIVGQLVGVDQVVLNTSGKISAGNGSVILSSNGIDLSSFVFNNPLEPDPTNNIFAIAWWPNPSNIGALDRPVARMWGGYGAGAGSSKGRLLQLEIIREFSNDGPRLWLQAGILRTFAVDNVDIVTLPGLTLATSSVTLGVGGINIGINGDIFANSNSINIGSSVNPFGNVYANKFIATTKNSVRSSIGEVGNTFSTIYVDNVVAGSITSSTQLSGQIWEFVGASDMYIRSNHASLRTLYVANQNSTNLMNLDVEGNIIVGGTVDGVDIASHANNVNAHHNKSHSLVGSDHTASGLTTGYVIRASDSTTFSWAQLAHSDLSGVGTNSHATIDSHISSTTAHGATGAVVGTTNTQTLTNKTLTTPTISDFTNANHAHTNTSSGGTISHSNLTSLSSDDHTQYYNQTRGDARYALNTITITAGDGLTGGGDLTTSRTLNVGAGTLISVSSDAVNLSNGTVQYQIPVTGVSPFTPAWTELSTFAGSGLTFSSGVFNVGAGSGITVNSDDVALTTPGTLNATTSNSSSSNHTHVITTGAATTLSVSSTNTTGSGTSLARADHTHAITSTSNASSASLLASDSGGGLGLVSLTIAGNTLLQNNQLFTTSGNISIASGSNIVLEPSGALVTLTSTKHFRSTTYTSGFAGASWSITGGTPSLFEVDNLSVRGTLRVYELLVQQIRATNGSLFVTSSAKIETVTGTGPYNLTVEGKSAIDAQPFAVGDIIRAQRIRIGSTDLIYRSDMTVTAINVGGNARVFTATLVASSTAPVAGYEYVRLGNTTTAARQGSIYLTSDDTGSPFIDIVTGITSHADWNTAGKIKMRMGRLDGITGQTNEFGMFAGDGWGSGQKVIVASNQNVQLQNVPINFGYGIANVGSMASNGNINWRNNSNVTVVSINGKDIDTTNSYLNIETLTGSNSYISLLTRNLRIGSTSSSGTLSVLGGEGTYSAPSFGSANLGAINIRNFTSDTRNAITFSSASANDVQAGIYVHQDNSFGTHMFFATTGSYAAGPQARLTILNNGNVGIGVTSPGMLLDVEKSHNFNVTLAEFKNSSDASTAYAEINISSGSSATLRLGVTDDAYSGWTGGSFIYSTNANGRLALGAGGSEKVSILPNGNVGIGTTSPTSILSVTDGVTPYAASIGLVIDTRRAVTNGTDNARVGLRLSNNSNAFSIFYGGTSDRLRFLDGADSEVMSLLNGGNVGIGTTSPSQKLDVRGPANFLAINVGDSIQTNYSTLVLGSDSGAAQLWKAGSIYSGWGGATSLNLYNSSGPVAIFSNGTINNCLFLNNSGNLGIGITNPTSKLYVYNSTAATHAYVTIQNSLSTHQAALQLATLTVNANWTMYIPGSSSDLRLFNGSDRVVFLANGTTQLNGTLTMSNQAINGVYSIQQHTSSRWRFDQNGDGYLSGTLSVGQGMVVAGTGHSLFVRDDNGGSSVQLSRTGIAGTEVVLIDSDITNAYWFGIIQDSTGLTASITSQNGVAYFETGVSAGREYTVDVNQKIYIYVKTNGSFGCKRTVGNRTYSVSLFVIWR